MEVDLDHKETFVSKTGYVWSVNVLCNFNF